MRKITNNSHSASRHIRVISETGDNLGIMSEQEALRIANDRGLDLVEINAKATPQVARLACFDKLRYREEKDAKRSAGKKPKKGKEIRFGLRTDNGHLGILARKVTDFLEHGHPVSLVLRLKGRERQHEEQALVKMEEFLRTITLPHRCLNLRNDRGAVTVSLTRQA